MHRAGAVVIAAVEDTDLLGAVVGDGIGRGDLRHDGVGAAQTVEIGIVDVVSQSGARCTDEEGDLAGLDVLVHGQCEGAEHRADDSDDLLALELVIGVDGRVGLAAVILDDELDLLAVDAASSIDFFHGHLGALLGIAAVRLGIARQGAEDAELDGIVTAALAAGGESKYQREYEDQRDQFRKLLHFMTLLLFS